MLKRRSCRLVLASLLIVALLCSTFGEGDAKKKVRSLFATPIGLLLTNCFARRGRGREKRRATPRQRMLAAQISCGVECALSLSANCGKRWTRPTVIA